MSGEYGTGENGNARRESVSSAISIITNPVWKNPGIEVAVLRWEVGSQLTKLWHDLNSVHVGSF